MKFPITVRYAGDVITFTGSNNRPVTHSEAMSFSGKPVYESAWDLIDLDAEVVLDADTRKAVKCDEQRYYRIRNGSVHFSFGEVSGWRWMETTLNPNNFVNLLDAHDECDVPKGKMYWE